MYFTMRAQPLPHQWNGSDRALLCRLLEVTTASLKELHLMRQEAEEKVRGVLDEQQGSQEINWVKWQRTMAAEESMTWVRSVVTKTKKNLDLNQSRATNPELGHIQEEVVTGRLWRNKLDEIPSTLIPDEPITIKSQERPDQVDQARVLTRKLAQGKTEQARPTRSIPEQTREDLGRSNPRQNQEKADLVTRDDRWQSQRAMWARADAKEPTQNPDNVEQSEGRELPLSPFPTELASLRRIGSGPLAPRLRLGSSGVTSDLLFTRRMSGNCLSAHSSGFYETSDLDSTSSSCSSLCSDTSCHTSISLMSPHRSSVMRPKSIDCTAERRKELQKGRAQARRPMSAGALDGFLIPSVSNSRYDLTQSYDMTPCDYPFSATPPLCAIQQRCKAERYICKMALKYRCKPGVTTLPVDFGPPTPRRQAPAFLQPDCHSSCPPSPQVASLSSSLGDIRKPPRGSWGRFFSRVMLRRDSRTAASELNLDQCCQSPQHSLRGQSIAEGQLLRAKSFRDLFSVKQFKISQRGLNKVW